jgi:hypothetical protein
VSDVPTKVCTGPAHTQPTRLPLTETYWYFHKSGPYAGKPQRCRLCAAYRRLPSGTVPVTKTLRSFARELVERCGSGSAVELRHGIAGSTILGVARGECQRMHRETATRLLTALGEQRKLDRRNGASSRFLAARRAQALSELRMSQLTGY